jgi:hypothetical protein
MHTLLDAELETTRKRDSETRVATRILEEALETAVGQLAKMTGFKKERDIT